ncbi:MAG: magnesium transporter [Candidatus Nealsonbacteria bacterium]|nr:magnesium transporter [Candidatus Nealsonbacteria bacterium]
MKTKEVVRKTKRVIINKTSYMQKSKNKNIQETAGGRMIGNVPLAFPDERISEIRKRIFEKAGEFETLNYIYVINEENKLKGVLSIKEIFQKEEGKAGDLMTKEIIKVYPQTDQEKIAILAIKHNLKAIPVVDKEGKFLGVVSSNTILNILHSEHIEDLLLFSGLHKNILFKDVSMNFSAGILAKERIPWLFFGLFGGIFAAQLVSFFETPLKGHFILAAFIPLMVYMADAVGAQSQTLFIRRLIIDYELNIKKYLFREIKVSFLIALVLGIILSLISLIWFSAPVLIGFILGISLFLTIIFASLIAILIPCLLNFLKKDPAVGAGPVATIIRDVSSLLIYFLIASLLFKLF